HDVDGPRCEVFGDHRAEALGERRFGGDEGLLDVLARVLTGRQEDVVVGMVSPGALENLQVNLLAYLGFDGGRVLLRGEGHPVLLSAIIAWPLGASRAVADGASRPHARLDCRAALGPRNLDPRGRRRASRWRARHRGVPARRPGDPLRALDARHRS